MTDLDARSDAYQHATPLALYDPADVEAVLGSNSGVEEPVFGWEAGRVAHPDFDNPHLSQIRSLVGRGYQAAWRRLSPPGPDVATAVMSLGERAPHLADLTHLVVRAVRAARAMNQPLRLPPVLLLGPAGTGKSWFVQRLGACLGLPYREVSANLSSAADGLVGSHPIWRSSGPGLIARTLLREPIANPLIFVDEFDKSSHRSEPIDQFRPFYTLLEPENARRFVDEFLMFPINASYVNWILAANDVADIPAPIMDRLTVLTIPETSRSQRVKIIESIWTEEVSRSGGYFDEDIPEVVVERLIELSPRRARAVVTDAMMRAAAEHRRILQAGDVQCEVTPCRQMGFGIRNRAL